MTNKCSKKLLEFLAKKRVSKWLDENRTFAEDMENLINEMVMFEVKYGTRILYSFEKQNYEKETNNISSSQEVLKR